MRKSAEILLSAARSVAKERKSRCQQKINTNVEVTEHGRPVIGRVYRGFKVVEHRQMVYMGRACLCACNECGSHRLFPDSVLLTQTLYIEPCDHSTYATHMRERPYLFGGPPNLVETAQQIESSHGQTEPQAQSQDREPPSEEGHESREAAQSQ